MFGRLIVTETKAERAPLFGFGISMVREGHTFPFGLCLALPPLKQTSIVEFAALW